MKLRPSLANGLRGLGVALWNRVTGPALVGNRVVYGGRNPAGVYVDAETALRNAVVWACVQYLSKTIGQLPWRVHRPKTAGGSEIADSNRVDYLLHTRPNPEMGAFSFRQTLMFWALRYGNGYAEIERDLRGGAYWLWPIHPSRVCPRRRPDTGELYYEVWNHSGGMTELDAADMYHVRGFGDGPVGVNVIEYAAPSIGWAQATELFGSTFFSEGMNPSGIVSQTAALSAPALDSLRKELRKLYSGPRGERTVILDKGMTFEKLATNPNDAQFIETRQHQVAEICRWFGVPPHKVMHLLQATFSNIEHQSIEVVVDSITPWAMIFEQEADFKLFGAGNRQNLYTKMNMRGLMRGDNASRGAYYKDRFYTGSITPNQIKAYEDEEPMGPEGDVYFIPVNMQTIDRAIAAPVTPAPPAGDLSEDDTGDVPTPAPEEA